MYVPSTNAEHRPGVMHDHIEAHPLGTLVTSGAGGLFATHLPLVLDRGAGPLGALEGHLARANPHHRHGDQAEALVIFTGPDAYITPSWYPSKAQDPRTVPTWNYVAVHAYGQLRFVDDDAWLARHLERLTSRHEDGRPAPWSIADAPADYVAQLRRAIVGVSLEITRLEGKWKMSQNRSDADIDGVIAGLGGSADPVHREVASIVAERRPARR